MAFDIALVPQPYIELSLVAGGTIPVGQEIFMIGYHNLGQGYYGNAVSPPSVQKSITTTTGFQSIRADWWAFNGKIDSFTDAGGGQVTVTSIAHGRSDGDTTHIAETINYNGDYTISNVTTDTFEITAPFLGTETGIWAFHKGLSQPAEAIRYSGMIFKWDKYSMMRPDGSYYQWLNLNDPVKMSASGGDEYNWKSSGGTRYGHRRWSTRYYDYGINHSIGNITFTKLSTGSIDNELNDGDIVGSTIIGQMRHPEISHNPVRNPTMYATGEIPINKGRMIINTNGKEVTADDIITKLQSKPELQDMYILSHDGSSMYNGRKRTLILNAHMQAYNTGALFDIKDLNLVMLGGNFDHLTPYFQFTRCDITTIAGQASSWITEDCKYYDCVRTHEGNAYVFGASMIGENTFFRGACTFYIQKPSGFKFILGYPSAPAYFQWRYQRKYPVGDTNHSDMSNMFIKQAFMYLTDYEQNVVGEDRSGTMTDVAFDNKDFMYDFDVRCNFNRCRDNSGKSMDMLNVTSTRNDGKIIIYWASYSNNIGTYDSWYSRYGINLKIVDEDGSPIEGASVLLFSDEETDSGTTDVSGSVLVKALGYKISFDQSDAYGTTSDWLTQTLVVSKAGYQSIKIKNLVLKEGKSWTMKLSTGDGTKNVLYDSTFYGSIIQ